MEIGSLLLGQSVHVGVWEEVEPEDGGMAGPLLAYSSCRVESILNQAAVPGALGKGSMATLS